MASRAQRDFTGDTVGEGYTEGEGQILIELARRTVEHGIGRTEPLRVYPSDYSPALREKRASFTTLRIKGDLRGCMGTLEAERTLVEDVVNSSFTAAFQDPRFPPVQKKELASLEYHISILSPPERIFVKDEKDLVERLRPGIDGLVLRAGEHRATFLPSVWEVIPKASDFVRRLKKKARLDETFWSAEMVFLIYTTDSFSTQAI